MKISRLFALIQKEWVELWASRSWIVVLVLPLFVTFIYNVIYRQAERQTLNIAYCAPLAPRLQTAFAQVRLRLIRYPNSDSAHKALSEGEVAAVFSVEPDSRRLTLLADPLKSLEITSLVNALNQAIIGIFSQRSVPQIQVVLRDRGAPARWLSFPTWLIQILLAICLLQAAATIADEKERTLSSLLVSPLTWGDYLGAKLIWNSLLCVAALLLTMLLTGAPMNLWLLLTFGLLGSLLYTIISLLIGLCSPTPLFARALATLVYIISALPLMLRNLDFASKVGLKYFPSYLILLGLESSLGSQPTANLGSPGTILVLEAGVLLWVTWAALRQMDF